MNTFLLTVSTPDGNLMNEQAISICLRGTEGELAVLANHIPFVTAVLPCECRITLIDGREKVAHTDGGLLSVSKTGVTLLSSSFTWSGEQIKAL